MKLRHLSKKTPPKSAGEDSSALFLYIVLAWGFHWILNIALYYRRGFFHGMEYPFSTPLPAPVTRFGDFFAPYTAYLLAGGIDTTIAYLPAIYPIYEMLTWISKVPWVAIYYYLAIYFVGIIGLICIAFWNRPRLQMMSLVLVVVLSYPSLFAFHTGNVEAHITILTLAAALAAKKQNWTLFTIFVSIAGSLKIVPFLFFLIILKTKSKSKIIRQAIFASLIFFSIQICSILFLPGGLVDKGFGQLGALWGNFLLGKQVYREQMIDSVSGIHYGHSFLNAIHAIFGLNFMPSSFWSPIVAALCLLFGIVSIIFLIQRKADLWTYFAIIACTACVAPPTSTDYKLLYFVPPFILLLLEKEGSSSKYSLAPSLFIVSIMAPKGYLYLHGYGFFTAMVYMTPFIILVFQVFILFSVSKGRYRQANEDEKKFDDKKIAHLHEIQNDLDLIISLRRMTAGVSSEEIQRVKNFDLKWQRIKEWYRHGGKLDD